MPETPKDPREQLLIELQYHDWFYEYCDDFRAWSRGNEHHKLIMHLVAQVPDGQALYDQHKPKK